MATSTTAAWEIDPAALESLEKKIALLRDWITAVVTGAQTGLYLYGSGGIGKSHTVIGELEAHQADYRLFNSRMTAKGLFRALESAPDAVHVLEDMERLTNDRDAQGVLRSALWAARGRDRVVTWTTANGGEERFTFRGGIILIANRPLASLPELKALATRIIVYRLEVADAEIASLFCQVAAQGYQRDGRTLLDPEACNEVTQFLLSECRMASCPLDLRLLFSSFDLYRLWASDQTTCDWKDMVASRARETASHFRAELETLPREERVKLRREVVRRLIQQTDDADEQLRLYKEQTGKSRADFYRRKQEVESSEFDPEVNGQE